MAAHIVRSYETELARLADLLSRMGGLAEAQFASAMECILRRDCELAARMAGYDERIDELAREIHGLTVRLVALRQPLGIDLRLIMAAPRIATDLERIGDLAKNVAKRAAQLDHSVPPERFAGIARMGRLVGEQLNRVLSALGLQDAAAAHWVWESDRMIDDMEVSLFREFLSMMQGDGGTISCCTHLIFVCKTLERIGDHCTNIAEAVHFLATGEMLDGARPKGGLAA